MLLIRLTQSFQVVILIIIPKVENPDFFYANIFLKFAVLLQYIPRVVRIYPLYLKATWTKTSLSETAWTKAAFNLFLFILSSHVSSIKCSLLPLPCNSFPFKLITFLDSSCKSWRIVSGLFVLPGTWSFLVLLFYRKRSNMLARSLWKSKWMRQWVILLWWRLQRDCIFNRFLPYKETKSRGIWFWNISCRPSVRYCGIKRSCAETCSLFLVGHAKFEVCSNQILLSIISRTAFYLWTDALSSIWSFWFLKFKNRLFEVWSLDYK